MRAFLEAEELVREEIEVEVRPSSPTTDPRSGWPLTVPPLVILWVGERPLAVRLRPWWRSAASPPTRAWPT